jgi:hypothetical protein
MSNFGDHQNWWSSEFDLVSYVLACTGNVSIFFFHVWDLEKWFLSSFLCTAWRSFRCELREVGGLQIVAKSWNRVCMCSKRGCWQFLDGALRFLKWATSKQQMRFIKGFQNSLHFGVVSVRFERMFVWWREEQSR